MALGGTEVTELDGDDDGPPQHWYVLVPLAPGAKPELVCVTPPGELVYDASAHAPVAHGENEATGQTELLFKLSTASAVKRGVDIAFLSAFPAEARRRSSSRPSPAPDVKGDGGGAHRDKCDFFPECV